ncbi:MAG: hypothetical protein HOE90_22275 [Bacteriovoracaceae bacterium]|nr:hypothetical protein [Bacteriovoracaceae bacterium]
MGLLVKVFLISIFLISCTKTTNFEERDGVGILLAPEFTIFDADEISWKVGNGFSKKVSKGVKIEARLPGLDKSDAELIFEKYKTNSWVLKVRRTKGNLGSVDLSYFYVPFVSENNKRRVYHSNEVAFNILYAASYASSRFNSLRCPAFHHNLRIGDVDVVPIPSRKIDELRISTSAMSQLSAEPRSFGLRAYAINGGMKIAGEYKVEFALYNFHSKYLYSSWYSFPFKVVVSSERGVALPECTGVEVKANKRSSPSKRLQDLKW